MANLPFLFTYIKQCVIEDDLKKFSYNDHSITFPTKSIPVKVGKLQVNTRLIPQDVQDGSLSFLLVRCQCNIYIILTFASQQLLSSPLLCSPSYNRHSITGAVLQAQATLTPIENRFFQIENRLDASSARMDSIKNLCHQLKGNTDMIAGQLHQLSADLQLQAQAQAMPANKQAKLS